MTISFDDLRIVNAKINAFPYKSEVDEDWTPIDITGEDDCDSYATAKLYRLVHTYGWPETALRLACCYVETGEYHLVLLADFGTTTWVLDNRFPYPTEHSLLPYKWDKMWNHEMNAWEYAK